MQIGSLNDASFYSDEDYASSRIHASADVNSNHVQQIVIQSIIDDPYRYDLGFHSPSLGSHGFVPLDDTKIDEVDYDYEDVNDNC
jgi:hypothetical protein